jgi:hypothetical protein
LGKNSSRKLSSERFVLFVAGSSSRKVEIARPKRITDLPEKLLMSGINLPGNLDVNSELVVCVSRGTYRWDITHKKTTPITRPLLGIKVNCTCGISLSEVGCWCGPHTRSVIGARVNWWFYGLDGCTRWLRGVSQKVVRLRVFRWVEWNFAFTENNPRRRTKFCTILVMPSSSIFIMDD